MSTPNDQASGSFPTLRRNRRFWSLFAADSISSFGDRLHIFALFLLVYELTGKALDLGLLAIVQVIPPTLVAPFAGWLLERVDRRRMLVYMYLVQGSLVLLLTVVQDLGQVLLIAGLLGVARQFQDPARMAILPSIVRKDQIVQANALSVSTEHLLLVIGPAVAGVLVASFGIPLAFKVDAASYALAILFMLGVGSAPAPVRELWAKGSEAVREFFREVHEGFEVVWGDAPLRFAIAFLALTTAATSLQQPLFVLFVKDVLMAGDAGFGAVISMLGVGGIVGSGLAALTRRRLAPLPVVVVATLMDGVALVGFAMARVLWVAMLLSVLFGLLQGMLTVRVMSLFQVRVPEEARGRAFGWLGPIFGPLSVASIGVGTWLADRFGVVPVLAWSGGLEVLSAVGALMWLAARPLLAAAKDGEELEEARAELPGEAQADASANASANASRGPS